MPMLLDERRQNILHVVEQKGFVSLQELVDAIGSSESTIRRDLEFLDNIGQIRRTRGGASYIGDSLTALEERRTKSYPQKQHIAKAVAEFIQSGETVLLDGGTTTLEVARQLIGKQLQVVTNSMPIVNLLINQPSIELIVIGGYLYPKTGVALGAMATSALDGIHARRLVMSVGGVNEMGLYNSNSLLVETERKMMECAEEVIAVCDSSKFGHSALAHLCPLKAVHHAVVDDGISDEWQEILKSHGVQVTVVQVE